MTITGQFKDIENNLYTITITNGNSGNAVTIKSYFDGDESTSENLEIYFGGDPIQISTSIDNLFTTIIKKDLQINLVTNGYVGDIFFSDNARSSKVVLMKGSKCIFDGYLTQTTFSQDFSQPWDEFTLNAVDKLSVIEYYNYKNLKIDRYEEYKPISEIVSFKSLLLDSLSGLTTNSAIYYDLSKGVNSSRVANVFDDLEVTEEVIYGDEADDVWNKEDVLQELLQYLNLHIIQEGSDFYIFDWDNVIKGNQNWINLVDNTTVKLTLDTPRIYAKDHASDGTQITINDCYSQIEATCSLKNKEVVISSPMDSDSITSLYPNKQLVTREFISEGNGDDAHNSFKAMILGNSFEGYNDYRKVDWYAQVLQNSNWTFRLNGTPTEELVEYENGKAINQYKFIQYISGQYNIDYQGAALVALGSDRRDGNGASDNEPKGTVSMSNYLVIGVNGNQSNGSTLIANPTDTNLEMYSPIATYIGSNSASVFSPSDTDTTNYLVFQGNFTLSPNQDTSGNYSDILKYYNGQGGSSPVISHTFDGNDDGMLYTRKQYCYKYTTDTTEMTNPMPSSNWQPPSDGRDYTKYKFNYSQFWDSTDKLTKLPILECELKIGDKYCVETNIDSFGNSTFKWLTYEQCPTYNGVKYTTFSLGINPKIGDMILGKEYNIQNTITIAMNLDVEGTAIPIRKSDNLSGMLEFKILGPVNLQYDDITKRHRTWFRSTNWTSSSVYLLRDVRNIFIKDFKCVFATDNGMNNNSYLSDKDLVYQSYESEEYINKHSDTTFRFITQLTSSEAAAKGMKFTQCINSVSNSNDSNNHLLSLYNKVTNETAKAEEHFVDQYYRLYNQPTIELRVDVNDYKNIFNRYIYNYMNRKFFILSQDFNAIENKATLKLREIHD